MKESYTSASAFPAKLLKKKVIDVSGRIKPVHLQISPTNKCTLNCKFCSCSARDKELELSLDDIKNIVKKGRAAGTCAVTITGGGEPLCHPKISEIFEYIHKLNIKIGLVTNGTLLHKLKLSDLRRITWCRISHDDNRNFTDSYAERIRKTVELGKNIDWAFSYVVGESPNLSNIGKVVTFANKNGFTHVRLVSDLLNLPNVPPLKQIKLYLKDKLNINDSIVIYQERKDALCGTKRCLISLLKPVVGTNGKLYPCCGTQYAKTVPDRDFGDKDMTMGDAKDIWTIYNEQKMFDGSKCSTCYYSNYNWALEIITKDIEHPEWV